MITADPSTHSGAETLVGVLYSWEHQCGAVGINQNVGVGRAVNPWEFSMTDGLAALVLARRMERVAALREAQALSSMIWYPGQNEYISMQFVQLVFQFVVYRDLDYGSE